MSLASCVRANRFVSQSLNKPKGGMLWPPATSETMEHPKDGEHDCCKGRSLGCEASEMFKNLLNKAWLSVVENLSRDP